MLIATFHGAPCKFSIENVLSILSVSESGVMNVTMYIPIKNHHSILTQVKQLNILLLLYIVLTICFLLGQEYKVNFGNQCILSNCVLHDIVYLVIFFYNNNRFGFVITGVTKVE